MKTAYWKQYRARLPVAFLICFNLWVGVLLATLPPPAVLAAEGFAPPPGVNIKAQISLLKERVTELARNLVGDKVVDVVVDVNYLRSEQVKNDANKVKLPGFNQVVVLKQGNKREIVSGYTRVRQILVMIADTFPVEAEAVAQEIRLNGKFAAANGDTVRVMKVPERKPPAGESDEQNKDLAGLKKKLMDPKGTSARNRQLKKPNTAETLSEAEATSFLLRARAAYFKGRLNQALDQILQSISKNPNNPQAYEMLGSLYYAVDWKNMAVKYWEKSLALDPTNPDLRKLIDQVREGSGEQK